MLVFKSEICTLKSDFLFFLLFFDFCDEAREGLGCRIDEYCDLWCWICV